jgi:type I restriction enzyme, S subunit
VNDLGFLGSPLPAGWISGHISDVTSKVGSGATPRGGSTVYVESGTSFIRSQNVYDHEFNADGLAHITNDAAHQLRGVTVEAGDVLLNITGDSILRTCIVSSSVLPARVSQHVAILRSNGQVDPGFMQKWLSLPAMKDFMLGHSSGGTRKAVTKGHILSFPIPLPPLREQQGIATFLGALDDKIASNNRLVEQVPRVIAAHVTQALESGADNVSIADLAAYVNGGAYTKDASGTGRMVIRIAELNSGPGRSTVYSDIDVPDDKTARPGDILMSWSGSLGVYRWFRDAAIVNQHIFKVIPNVGFPPWLVFNRLEAVMPTFRGIARDKATTMGHIKRGHLESTAIDVPTVRAIESLDQALDPLWKRLLTAKRETLHLARLRDALLPELVSGRVRVPEASELVEAAAA